MGQVGLSGLRGAEGLLPLLPGKVLLYFINVMFYIIYINIIIPLLLGQSEPQAGAAQDVGRGVDMRAGASS